MRVARVVSDGDVYCAVQRRVVDVVDCYACEHLIDIDLDSRRPKLWVGRC